jgi:hypothetical protein
VKVEVEEKVKVKVKVKKVVEVPNSIVSNLVL